MKRLFIIFSLFLVIFTARSTDPEHLTRSNGWTKARTKYAFLDSTYIGKSILFNNSLSLDQGTAYLQLSGVGAYAGTVNFISSYLTASIAVTTPTVTNSGNLVVQSTSGDLSFQTFSGNDLNFITSTGQLTANTGSMDLRGNTRIDLFSVNAGSIIQLNPGYGSSGTLHLGGVTSTDDQIYINGDLHGDSANFTELTVGGNQVYTTSSTDGEYFEDSEFAYSRGDYLLMSKTFNLKIGGMTALYSDNSSTRALTTDEVRVFPVAVWDSATYTGIYITLTSGATFTDPDTSTHYNGFVFFQYDGTGSSFTEVARTENNPDLWRNSTHQRLYIQFKNPVKLSSQLLICKALFTGESVSQHPYMPSSVQAQSPHKHAVGASGKYLTGYINNTTLIPSTMNLSEIDYHPTDHGPSSYIYLVELVKQN